jgi:hypothetical protein
LKLELLYLKYIKSNLVFLSEIVPRKGILRIAEEIAKSIDT